jgi:hypothetical protein
MLDLIKGPRHASGTITLSGDAAEDNGRAAVLLKQLRDWLPHLPEDPHMLYATEVHSSEQHRKDRLPKSVTRWPRSSRPTGAAISLGSTLQGIRRIANSFGQRNWFTSALHPDRSFSSLPKAGSVPMPGRVDKAAFGRKVSDALAKLEVLARPPRTIEPGQYRVYLTERGSSLGRSAGAGSG